MGHAESSRGRTQVELLASFRQQYSEEKKQDTCTFILQDLYNLHLITNNQHFISGLQTCSIYQQIEGLFQTSVRLWLYQFSDSLSGYFKPDKLLTFLFLTSDNRNMTLICFTLELTLIEFQMWRCVIEIIFIT